MSDEAKAKKLAAARKKLKEYQQRAGAEQDTTQHIDGCSVSSNLSEKSDNEYNDSVQSGENLLQLNSNDNKNAIYTSPFPKQEEKRTDNIATPFESDNIGTLPDLNTIQVLVAEKTQLNNDLNKYRVQCREKEFKLEEVQTLLKSTSDRFDEVQQQFVKQQRSTEQLRANNAELQHKLAQTLAVNDDQNTHIEELKKELSLNKQKMEAQAQELKETNYKLDMAEIRIKQLSDETSLSNDNSAETMMQTQLMHEQQIRDLQAMLQQFTEEKEQAYVQYQNYVQQLNLEITKLNDRHVEVRQQNESLQQREQQLVNHISGLEREIQKNLNLQKKSQTATETNISSSKEHVDNAELVNKISDMEFERHEFVLKIKSQEDNLQLLKTQLQQSQSEIDSLNERLQALSSEQPEQTKLLAIMESDKVAASRALAQNVEMKKQLDELEIRFVQLTNEKADLRNLLDAEEYASRDIRTSYQAMEERLRSKDEFFKVKDEEMIRLAHENTELSSKVQELQKQLQAKSDNINWEVSAKQDAIDNCSAEVSHDIDPCDEAEKLTQNSTTTLVAEQNGISEKLTTDKKLYTSEAMEKLEEKFTKLMGQVANLTDEKQRLEHLVLQLQGETETIGEYITLYQTQRRMLKQREYEKAAQMQLLQEEREQLCEKIKMLNNLVSSLGVPSNMIDNIGAVDIPQEALPQNTPAKGATNQSNSIESQLIINKIQHIITEIEQNTKNPILEGDETQKVDQLNCCLGKFEVV